MANVAISSPRPFILIGDDRKIYSIPEGISNIEQEMTKHWFFAANAAVVIGPQREGVPVDEGISLTSKRGK